MNGSPRPATVGGNFRRKDVSLDLPTACGMLPYVQSIVAEVVDTAQKLQTLAPKQQLLDDVRRNLDWTNRQRRYAIQDEVQIAEANLAAAVSELDALGLTLANAVDGTVEFPTTINNRAAAFSWRLGEDALGHWHYQGEDRRRPIPRDWLSGGEMNRYRNA
jgi:hypothetical protein